MKRIKKNDLVVVTTGKDRGRTGKILETFPEENKCIVEGVFRVKRHQKATQQGGPSGIIEKSMKVDMSNVMPFDSKSNKGSRVRVDASGKEKKRVFVKSGEAVPAEA